ncbi:MAG: tetratricopeptide repeat protein, partial [Deltaproteobacteria bacterium]|nr:tetratricopeptide repeat protein [Deltaproteobacteria bacterium]
REETDPARLEILRKRMREVIVERDIQFLERAVDAYRQNTGEVPATLTDLLRSGLIPRIPVEPHGGKYLLQPDGTVRSDRVTGRLKVFKPSGTGEER